MAAAPRAADPHDVEHAIQKTPIILRWPAGGGNSGGIWCQGIWHSFLHAHGLAAGMAACSSKAPAHGSFTFARVGGGFHERSRLNVADQTRVVRHAPGSSD